MKHFLFWPKMEFYREAIGGQITGPFRAMACVDGYYMARRKGCTPFVIPCKDALDKDGKPINREFKL